MEIVKEEKLRESIQKNLRWIGNWRKVNTNAINVTKVLEIWIYYNITLNPLILALKDFSVEIALSHVMAILPSDFTWNPNIMTMEEYWELAAKNVRGWKSINIVENKLYLANSSAINVNTVPLGK